VKKFLLIFLVFCSLSVLFAQSNRPRAGVLDFTANNISKSEALIIGEMFTSELVLSGKYDVVDRKNIESLMNEMEFQMSGCTDSSCAVEVGQILSLEYMMYGSINKLGQDFIINVNVINVETAQITGSARERFATIEQSYDIMPLVIQKLVQGESYIGGSAPLRSPPREAAAEKELHARFLELGAGYVTGDFESGIEIEGSYRHMLGDTFGLAGGILFGVSEGFRFGIRIGVHFQLTEKLGLGIDFRGLPTHISAFGGPSVGVYYGPFFGRVGAGFLGGFAVNADFGYCLSL
jgi:hypothetical protein